MARPVAWVTAISALIRSCANSCWRSCTATSARMRGFDRADIVFRELDVLDLHTLDHEDWIVGDRVVQGLGGVGSRPRAVMARYAVYWPNTTFTSRFMCGVIRREMAACRSPPKREYVSPTLSDATCSVTEMRKSATTQSAGAEC